MFLGTLIVQYYSKVVPIGKTQPFTQKLLWQWFIHKVTNMQYYRKIWLTHPNYFTHLHN